MGWVQVLCAPLAQLNLETHPIASLAGRDRPWVNIIIFPAEAEALAAANPSQQKQTEPTEPIKR